MGKIILTIDEYIDDRHITRYRLAEGTGIRYETINRYYHNRVTRFDSFILAKVCDYLECELTDILKYSK